MLRDERLLIADRRFDRLSGNIRRSPIGG